MKRKIHQAIALVFLIGLFASLLDSGIWMMNQPYDFTFFMGLMTNIVAGIIFGHGLHRILNPKFNTIKDLFTYK
jgi:hypothetical protein